MIEEFDDLDSQACTALDIGLQIPNFTYPGVAPASSSSGSPPRR